MFPIFAGNSASTGYNLTRSLRFRRSASGYLSRTAGAGSQQIMTLSFWFKRGVLGVAQYIYGSYSSGSAFSNLYIESTNQIGFADAASATNLLSTQVFRDPSAWYHIVVAIDTTQATAANRVKFYVNNVQITAFASSTYPAQNTNLNLNSAVNHTLFNNAAPAATNYTDGYLAETNFVNAQQLTPSSFGSTNALTGVWQPAKYSGSYGTNGFYLPFTDNSALTTSSNVGLGKDFSGNGNYWATNNISITAGATYDSMTDMPTLTSATAANFAVLNPLSTTAGTYSNANLQYYGASAWRRTNGTIAVNSNKWYWEVTLGNAPFTPRGSTTSYNAFGFGLSTVFNSTSSASTVTDAIILGDNAYYKNFSGAWTDSGLTFVSGDVLSVAVDLTANTFTFYRNNSSVVTGTIGVTAGTTLTPIVLSYDNSYGLMNANFGQRPFTYTPPTGFVALNTFNLPDSTIVKGNTVMDATLYTGTLLSNAITNAASFRPDLVWPKSRSAATSNKLTDSVRGVTKALVSNSDSAETTDVQGITAINSNGFTVGTNTDYNNLAATYVAWQWQAGQGSTSSNTNGTITSTVSVNASAGFSVVTYTGNGTNPGATIGHGLGVAPAMIICKNRSNIDWWPSYHVSAGITNTLYLNDTVKSNTYLNRFSAVSSTTFTTGVSGSELNTSANNYVAYCWTPIAGYSAFGSYTGNGSTDGPFVYTGFRPKFVMFKRTDSAADWEILDSTRNTYNLTNLGLYPNGSYAEQVETNNVLDLLSNGFKVRGTGSASNVNGASYIYACWAETPFKNSLAR